MPDDNRRSPEQSDGLHGPHAYTLSGFAQYVRGLGTLKASGGDLGGGSEMLILEPEPTVFRDDVTIKIDAEGTAFTLGARDFKGVQCVSYTEDSVQTYSNQAIGEYAENDKASSLKQRDYKDATDLVVGQGESFGTLCAESYPGKLAHQDVASGLYPTTGQVVRRLTPLECERLQGYPDNYTLIGEPEEVEVKDYETTYDEDGNETGKRLIGTHKEVAYFYTDANGKKKRCTDSARYKALGNSIALPFWFYLLRRISAQYERPATLGSLFDGIGGFPLCWERCNGKGTAVWASEIEEFPIAVTKKHFPEEKEDT